MVFREGEDRDGTRHYVTYNGLAGGGTQRLALTASSDAGRAGVSSFRSIR